MVASAAKRVVLSRSTRSGLKGTVTTDPGFGFGLRPPKKRKPPARVSVVPLAKVTLARDEAVWKFTFDADSFTLRSAQLPQGEDLDPISRFQDRMLALDTLREVITGFYTRFLDERLNTDEWKAIREDIRKWVGNRRSKA